MNQMTPVISVVTPMFNEEEVVEVNIYKLINYLKQLDETWEVILVNDGSTDRSLEIAKSLEPQYPNLKVVSYPRNRGRGYAIRTGIAQTKGQFVITVEFDLNYGPQIIELLRDSLKEQDADIVIASPYMKGGKVENVPKKRAFLSSFGNKVLKLSIKSNIHTVTGMTRGYRGEVIRRLYLEEDGKEIHLEIISKAEVMGYTIMEIPAILSWPKEKIKGPKRKSKFNMWRLIKSHLVFATNEAPILLFGSIGGFFLVAGFSLGLKLSFDFLIKGEIIGDRIISILSIIFLSLSGIIILLVSFLAYQLRNLKKEMTKVKQLLHQSSISKN